VYRPPDVERRDFRFLHRLRVRWPEVDAQRVVFNGQYLAYFDVANSAYWRAAALPYPEAFERFGGDTFVKKATLEYHGSAAYDDFVDAGMKCSRVGNSSLTFTAAFFRGGDLLATAEVVYVFVDAATRRPATFPAPLREAVTAFEAGEAPVRVEVLDWERCEADVRSLRDAQDADARASHVVVRDRSGRPVATGRLDASSREGAETAGPEIAGVVVRPSMRGSGMGRLVVDALADLAAERGALRLLARPPAQEVGFIARVGFTRDADGRLLRALTRRSE
jgi:YbgC/YbaW family acyl-CoA thioester hydrolase